MNLRLLVPVAIAFALSACGGGSPKAVGDSPTAAAGTGGSDAFLQGVKDRLSPVTVDGTFTLLFPSSAIVRTIVVAQDQTCFGTGGYGDINAGTQVKLAADNSTIDVQPLGTGHLAAGNCVFSFTLTVPPGHKFYDVSIGRRGTFTYTFDQITTPGTIALSLGN